MDQQIEFAVFDSVAFACDGPPEAAEVAGRYFRSVREIGGGSLHVAHINKGDNAEKKPFGSTFWHNGARATWFVKASEPFDDASTLTLGLFNRKCNLGALRHPVGFGIEFTEARTAFVRTGIRDCPDLAESMTVRQRMSSVLRHGISGAAFNSNMGFHTSPALAFLLTVFGVRLGWWAGNPRSSTWQKPSPPLGIGPLARELTANTTTSSDFVLLSDGGHFENMGLYELVRRRCRYMIVVDAEEDEEFKLEGIGGAVRKCRVDFGIVINLNLEALQPLGDPAVSKLHYTLGSVSYPGEHGCAHLIYIKSSVTGDEPVDVVEFRKRHSEFPHTSTANQFFDEAHFESYRALGHHIAADIFLRDINGTLPPSDRVKDLFRTVEIAWKARMSG